jgi:hypothetical protein
VSYAAAVKRRGSEAAPARAARPERHADAEATPAGLPLFLRERLGGERPGVAAETGGPPLQTKCACATGSPCPTCADGEVPAIQAKCAACSTMPSPPAPTDERQVQQREQAGPPPRPATVRALGRRGLETASAPLPHLERIQAAFGRHDVSGVRTQVGGEAGAASGRMGALAYTSGQRIGFASPPDVRLAAHEAAHVVQQRVGVKLDGGVGRAGDGYERRADEVGEAVAQGRSAEALLDEGAGGAVDPEHGVQMKLPADTTRVVEPAIVTARPPAPRPAGAAGGSPGAPAKDAPSVAGSALAGAGAGAGAAVSTPTSSTSPPAAAGAGATTDPASTAGPSAAAGAGGGAAAPDPAVAACPRPAPPQGPAAESKPSAGQRVQPSPGANCVPFAPKAPPHEEPPEGMTDEPPEPTPGRVQGDIKPDGPVAEQAPGFGENPAAKEVAKASKGDDADKLATAAAKTASGRATGGAPRPAGLPAAPAMPGGAPLEGAVGAAESQRGEAQAAYERSAATLADAGDRVSRVGAPVRFAGAGGAAAADERHARSSSRASSFFASAGGELARLVEAAATELPERLAASATTATERIAAGTEAQRTAVSGRFSRVRGAAHGRARALTGQIEARHATSVLQITLATVGAEVALARGRAAALSRIAELEGPQYNDVGQKYRDGMASIRATGPRVGDDALEIGKRYMAVYDRGHRAGALGHDRTDLDAADISLFTASAAQLREHQRTEEGHEKDGFWDGYLTDRRAHARMKAARDVARGYRDSFLKEADKQAFEALRGLSADVCTVGVRAATARKQVEDQYTALRAALGKGRQAALAGAEQARRELTDIAHGQFVSTLRTLDAQETAQRQTLADAGTLHRLAVEQAVHTAGGDVAAAVATVADGVDETLATVRETFAAAGAPDPASLTRVLDGAEARLAGGLGRARDAVDRGATSTEGAVAEVSETGLASLADVAGSAGELVDALGAGFGSVMTALGTGTDDTFGRLTSGYTDQTAELSTSATNGFQGVGDGLKTVFDAMSTGLAKGFEKQAEGLEAGLRDSLGTMCDADQGIPHYAQEAADREQPAWKKVVAILLIIVVIVVVALVVGPFVIGGIGALAGGGAFGLVVGGVVGGALIGAATSATITMINNWASGQDLLTGVGRAALVGAITGAIGGGLGVGINAAVTGGTQVAVTLGQRALMLGLNAVADVGVEIGTTLATGGDFSLESLGVTALTSLLTGGFGEIKGVGNVQKRFSGLGERAGGALRARATGVPAPRVAPHVETTARRAAPEPVEAAARPAASEPVAGESVARPASAEVGGGVREGVAPTAVTDKAAPARPTSEADAAPRPAPERARPPTSPEAQRARVDAEGGPAPQTDTGVLAHGHLEGGGVAKVTEGGHVVVCRSPCQWLRDMYGHVLPEHPTLETRLRAIENDAAEARALMRKPHRTEADVERAGDLARTSIEATQRLWVDLQAAHPGARMVPPNGEINIGGGGEIEGAVNVNPAKPGTGGPSIEIPEPWVPVDFTEVGNVFAPGSVKRIAARRLPVNTVDWPAAAAAARRVAAPDASIDLHVYGQMSAADLEGIVADFHAAGFPDVEGIKVGTGAIITNDPVFTRGGRRGGEGSAMPEGGGGVVAPAEPVAAPTSPPGPRGSAPLEPVAPVLSGRQERMLQRLMRRFERQGLSRDEALRMLGLKSEADLRRLAAGTRSEEQLRTLLAERAERLGVAARAELNRTGRREEPVREEGFEDARTLDASDLRTLATSDRPLPTAVERRMLQDVVDDVSVRLMLDPEEAARYLTVGERAALAERPDLAAAYFGNAVERRVALELADRPELARFHHVPQRPFVSTPDIGGPIGPRGPRAYDVTTERGVAAHEGRTYAPFTEWVTYPSLPRGWRFPRT